MNSSKLLITLLALAGTLCGPALRAATLSVQVLGADGQPAPNAVVEVLTPQAPKAAPAKPIPIVQRHVRFEPYVTAIPAGATVRFVNEDDFDHHLRSLPAGPLGTIPPAQEFELRMAPGSPQRPTTAELKFEQPGLVVLGCHLHGAMRGHIYVGHSPLLAVTDAQGRASVSGVPEGRAEIRLWHPEQLIEQPPTPWQVGGPADQTLRLNFTPPKPRARRG